jgi:hypothetical protein
MLKKRKVPQTLDDLIKSLIQTVILDTRTGQGGVRSDALIPCIYSPFFTLEHGKGMIERSRFNIAPVKKDVAVVEHPVVIAEVEQLIR